MHNGFVWQEKVSEDIQRLYFFTSDTAEIYNCVINNINLFKKFLKFFKQNNQEIIEHFRLNKFNIAEHRNDYFIDSHTKPVSQREQLNKFLHSLELLDKGTHITEREWQCIEMLQLGQSASKTGEILKISRRTVETHLQSVKDKLGVRFKSEIL